MEGLDVVRVAGAAFDEVLYADDAIVVAQDEAIMEGMMRGIEEEVAGSAEMGLGQHWGVGLGWWGGPEANSKKSARTRGPEGILVHSGIQI